MTRVLEIPELSLVVLVGVSGSGKSTFARTHFLPTEVVSSDFCRGVVSDDENDQGATADAFDLLHYIAGKRMARGRLTVVDATNVQPEARRPLVSLAKEHHFLPVAIVFDLPERLCHDRNRDRPDRDFGAHVIRNQHRQLRRGLRNLKREGFRHVHALDSPEAVEAAAIEPTPLWNNRMHEHGPFDVVGDVHGCADELEELLALLGYTVVEQREGEFPDGGPVYAHPEGRTALFVGDLVGGPRILDTLRIARNMVEHGSALAVPGNHDLKLVRALRGRDVRITQGLDRSLAELDELADEQKQPARDEVVRFLDGLVSHYVFDDGNLVVAHAGMKKEMQGRGSGRVRNFALYRETTGETDEFGLPVRWNWAAEYRGHAIVVYGHTPVPEPEWLNRTINIDTGCVFGGRLTALRYPEQELVSVPSQALYAEPAKPFLPEAELPERLTAQQREDELLDIEDVLGKRLISTRHARTVTIREENAIAALEVMGRFAVDPRRLVYLPPAVSPSETSQEPGLLEHPAEAFAHYRHEGVARRRFGVVAQGFGICYTRTGRRFFDDPALEAVFLERIRAAADTAGLFDELATDWLLLDCELMPWSAKAQQLLSEQYAAVGSAGRAALAEAVQALDESSALGGAADLAETYRARLDDVGRYIEAYRRYCWPVEQVTDLKLAPFHLLASEKAVHVGKPHSWHMDRIARMVAEDEELLRATANLAVGTTDPAAEDRATAWWQELTNAGGEGMVVKPMGFVVRGRRGLVQPALKVRGREYLRIISGPEYVRPAHIERLRRRSLGAK